MRVEIRKLQRRLKTTAIYVTHDQLEAMTLADILVVMNGGQVEQIGNPLDIYQKPATTFRRLVHRRAADESDAAALERDQSAILRRQPCRWRRRHPGNPPRGFCDLQRRRRPAVSRSTSPWKRSSVSAPRPSSTAPGRRMAQGVAANPGDLPPGEVIVRIPGATAPAIGERIRRDRAARESCICSAPTAASGSIINHLPSFPAPTRGANPNLEPIISRLRVRDLRSRPGTSFAAVWRVFLRFRRCLNSSHIMPILLVDRTANRQPVSHGAPQGP